MLARVISIALEICVQSFQPQGDVMSLGKKFFDHVFLTPIETMTEGMKVGHRFGKALGASELGSGATAFLGGAVGATLGGARLINPVDVVQTLARTDEEIQQREDKIFDVFDKM